MKIAIVLLAGSDSSEGTGRMANAFITAREAQDAGDQVRIVFDGAGTTWLKTLADPDHKYHRLLASRCSTSTRRIRAFAGWSPMGSTC